MCTVHAMKAGRLLSIFSPQFLPIFRRYFRKICDYYTNILAIAIFIVYKFKCLDFRLRLRHLIHIPSFPAAGLKIKLDVRPIRVIILLTAALSFLLWRVTT